MENHIAFFYEKLQNKRKRVIIENNYDYFTEGQNMEDTVIVIMLKDKETGFFEKELGCYKIDKNDEFIYNTFAYEENDGFKVLMKLTCDREVSDWEFDAIFDYYDTETLLPFVTSIKEEEDCYNPTWNVTFDFLDNIEAMEEKISGILNVHANELKTVYEAIADKKDEYLK